jgi:hypothetical protein
MYKVKFYFNHSSNVGVKIFKTLEEATAFGRKIGVGNVIDTVLMKENE